MNKILIILIIMSLIEIIPILLTTFNPNLCYGCTKIGKYHQHLNDKIYFTYINWMGFIILNIYLIYVIDKNNVKNKYLLIGLILLFSYIIIWPILVILNIILILYFTNQPFIYDYKDSYPELIKLENSSNDIINEFNNYYNKYMIDCIHKTVPGFTINISDNGNYWRALYLKRAGKIDIEMINDFQITTNLIKDEIVHNAFFSILNLNVEIPPHTGYFKGYLRYHLGVVIPKGENKAFIVCNGEKYIWKQNEGILFDDMYNHYVKNDTNEMRVVLYLDIKRKTNNMFISNVINLGIYLIENSILLNIF